MKRVMRRGVFFLALFFALVASVELREAEPVSLTALEKAWPGQTLAFIRLEANQIYGRIRQAAEAGSKACMEALTEFLGRRLSLAAEDPLAPMMTRLRETLMEQKPAVHSKRSGQKSAIESLAQGIEAYHRKNYGMARKLLEEATAKNNFYAAWLLGTMLAEGKGGAPNRRRGLELVNAACARGIDPACSYYQKFSPETGETESSAREILDSIQESLKELRQ